MEAICPYWLFDLTYESEIDDGLVSGGMLHKSPDWLSSQTYNLSKNNHIISVVVLKKMS